MQTRDLAAFSSNHNITPVNPLPFLWFTPFSRLQMGSLRLRATNGSLPFSAFHAGFGLGSAYSISMLAARSSARASIIRLINSISDFLKFEIRFSRLSFSSASWPLFRVSRYSTNLCSLLSAVSGWGIRVTSLAQKITELTCQLVTTEARA